MEKKTFFFWRLHISAFPSQGHLRLWLIYFTVQHESRCDQAFSESKWNLDTRFSWRFSCSKLKSSVIEDVCGAEIETNRQICSVSSDCQMKIMRQKGKSTSQSELYMKHSDTSVISLFYFFYFSILSSYQTTGIMSCFLLVDSNASSPWQWERSALAGLSSVHPVFRRFCVVLQPTAITIICRYVLEM